jgi:Spy/CpxP family protein refolding chaperone
MSPSKHLALATALLLAPLCAHAQQPPHAAPHPAPTPAVAPAAEPFPGDALAIDAMAFDDDLLAFGMGDDFGFDSGDLNRGDGDSDASAALDDPHGVDAHDMQYGPGGMGMGMHHGGRGGRPMFSRRAAMGMRARMAQLDLTEAQSSKLRDLHEAHARKAVQRRADVQLARMDLRKLMRADKPDVGAVNAQIDKISRMQAEGLKSAFEVRMQARAVLTPEQLKKLRAPMDPMRMRQDMMDTPDGQPKR